MLELRDELTANLSEMKIAQYFKNNNVLRKLVMLVLISINSLLPADEKHQEQDNFDQQSQRPIAKTGLDAYDSIKYP